MSMVDVKPGEVYVPGATPKVARALLANARRAGLPHSVVRTTEGGFVVPTVVAPGNQDPAEPPSGKTARILPVDPPPEPKKKAAGTRSRRKTRSKDGD